jgi:hypothetical protein
VNTPTHTLLALALLSRPQQRKRNLTVIAGSLIPDLAIFLWAPYQSFVNGVSGEEMWRELYFAPSMQNLIAWFNSIPIYLGLIALGFLGRGKAWGKLLLVFAAAALIHMATDLPVHAEDAYRHFWPLTDWRFYSPLSYWDEAHHARWVGTVEIILAGGCIALLWRRHPAQWVKIALSLLALFYVVVLAFIVLPR